MVADSLYILHQFLRGVVFQARMRGGAPRPTLIEQDDAVHAGVEKAPVVILLAAGETASDQKVWYMSQLLKGMEGASSPK